MLVLSRKPDQEILIDGHIRIRVTRISGNRVTLAIDAPRETTIMRGELRPFGLDAGPGQPSRETSAGPSVKQGVRVSGGVPGATAAPVGGPLTRWQMSLDPDHSWSVSATSIK